MNSQSATPQWYRASSEAKHLRQIVVNIPATNEVPAQVGSLFPPGQSHAFMTQSWAAITLFMGVFSDNRGPFVFVRAEGYLDQFRGSPLKVAFCFYRMRAGGLFTVCVHVLCPSVEKRTGNAAVFENHHNLDAEEPPKLVSALIEREQLDVCFTASGASGPCTGYYGMAAPLPVTCREALRDEWDQLLQYHQGISAGMRNFPARIRQYEQENPMNETPVLPLQLKSLRFEGQTVAAAQAAAAASGIAPDKIVEVEVTREVREALAEGEGKSALAAIEAAKKRLPAQAFETGAEEVVQPGQEGVVEIQAQTESEARARWKMQMPPGAALDAFQCAVQPKDGFLGVGKKPGMWKAFWSSPFKVRIAYKLPAQVTVKYIE